MAERLATYETELEAYQAAVAANGGRAPPGTKRPQKPSARPDRVASSECISAGVALFRDGRRRSLPSLGALPGVEVNDS